MINKNYCDELGSVKITAVSGRIIVRIMLWMDEWGPEDCLGLGEEDWGRGCLDVSQDWRLLSWRWRLCHWRWRHWTWTWLETGAWSETECWSSDPRWDSWCGYHQQHQEDSWRPLLRCELKTTCPCTNNILVIVQNFIIKLTFYILPPQWCCCTSEQASCCWPDHSCPWRAPCAPSPPVCGCWRGRRGWVCPQQPATLSTPDQPDDDDDENQNTTDHVYLLDEV